MKIFKIKFYHRKKIFSNKFIMNSAIIQNDTFGFIANISQIKISQKTIDIFSSFFNVLLVLVVATHNQID